MRRPRQRPAFLLVPSPSTNATGSRSSSC
jgi:hypothetical protein